MDSLRIDTGVKRIAINDDPQRVITFNPNDVAFAERFYQLIRDFEGKQAEYQARAKAFDNQDVDDNGIPVNIGEGLAFMREFCEYARGQIDRLFGAGTSQKAFEDAMTLDMFEQFFSGITPFIQNARADKMSRYLNSEISGRVMK